MAQCMAMGQAAGTAAALAATASADGAVREVDPCDAAAEPASRPMARSSSCAVETPARMTFIRTVLGDIDPSALGVTYAHEHLVIDGGRPVEMSAGLPPQRRRSADRRASRAAAAPGSSAAIDMMPADCGRNPLLLAELSRRTGVHLVAATGLHHERFYRAVALEPARDARTSWPTCSSRTSTTGSTSATTRARSSHRTDIRAGVDQGRRQPGRPLGPRPADLPRRGRAPMSGPASRSTPTARPAPARSSRSGSWSTPASPPARDLAQPRRQGRRPRLPPRALRHRRGRRIRPGRSAGATAPTARSSCSSGRSRTATAGPVDARAWTPPARATTRRTAGRPASPGCSTASATAWRRGASTRPSGSGLFVDNPARAFAFADAGWAMSA